MRELKSVSIGPRQTFELKAGGKHLMLMQPHSQLEAGAKIPLEVVGTDGCISIFEMTVTGKGP
jgi:copper(I)-binding protein